MGENLPAPVNNRWVDDSDADSVVVYVHGFLSSSASCWEYTGGRGAESMTWPRLVRGDGRLQSPAIFLGGYTTNVDSKWHSATLGMGFADSWAGGLGAELDGYLLP